MAEEAYGALKWRHIGPHRGGRVFLLGTDHHDAEVAIKVIDGPQSVGFDQIKNRLHTPHALLNNLLKGSAKSVQSAMSETQ